MAGTFSLSGHALVHRPFRRPRSKHFSSQHPRAFYTHGRTLHLEVQAFQHNGVFQSEQAPESTERRLT